MKVRLFFHRRQLSDDIKQLLRSVTDILESSSCPPVSGDDLLLLGEKAEDLEIG